ncbi:hypothetical protein PENTCL1PPCAC_1527, partial [Pristionchus entomophagus]
YGVVVEKYSSGFGVWQLFRSAESGLTALSTELCGDARRVGDIVQARSEKRVIRGWPFPNSIWIDGNKLVVRTIVSYCKEVTRGKWTDDNDGGEFVVLISRDIGLVVAPIQCYSREFSAAGEFHHFAYV